MFPDKKNNKIIIQTTHENLESGTSLINQKKHQENQQSVFTDQSQGILIDAIKNVQNRYGDDEDGVPDVVDITDDFEDDYNLQKAGADINGYNPNDGRQSNQNNQVNNQNYLKKQYASVKITSEAKISSSDNQQKLQDNKQMGNEIVPTGDYYRQENQLLLNFTPQNSQNNFENGVDSPKNTMNLQNKLKISHITNFKANECSMIANKIPQLKLQLKSVVDTRAEKTKYYQPLSTEESKKSQIKKQKNLISQSLLSSASVVIPNSITKPLTSKNFGSPSIGQMSFLNNLKISKLSSNNQKSFRGQKLDESGLNTSRGTGGGIIVPKTQPSRKNKNINDTENRTTNLVKKNQSASIIQQPLTQTFLGSIAGAFGFNKNQQNSGSLIVQKGEVQSLGGQPVNSTKNRGTGGVLLQHHNANASNSFSVKMSQTQHTQIGITSENLEESPTKPKNQSILTSAGPTLRNASISLASTQAINYLAANGPQTTKAASGTKINNFQGQIAIGLLSNNIGVSGGINKSMSNFQRLNRKTFNITMTENQITNSTSIFTQNKLSGPRYSLGAKNHLHKMSVVSNQSENSRFNFAINHVNKRPRNNPFNDSISGNSIALEAVGGTQQVCRAKGEEQENHDGASTPQGSGLEEEDLIIDEAGQATARKNTTDTNNCSSQNQIDDSYENLCMNLEEKVIKTEEPTTANRYFSQGAQSKKQAQINKIKPLKVLPNNLITNHKFSMSMISQQKPLIQNTSTLQQKKGSVSIPQLNLQQLTSQKPAQNLSARNETKQTKELKKKVEPQKHKFLVSKSSQNKQSFKEEHPFDRKKSELSIKNQVIDEENNEESTHNNHKRDSDHLNSRHEDAKQIHKIEVNLVNKQLQKDLESSSNPQQPSSAIGVLRESSLGAQQLQQSEVKADQLFPISANDALGTFGSYLNDYERQEIVRQFDGKIYYCGQNCKKKIKGHIIQSAGKTAEYIQRHKDRLKQMNIFNHGYDDENGDYQVILKDHLGYRYEVLEFLGQGSFGQAIKCLDHKTNKEVAIKIIRNKKKFQYQAGIELRILKYLNHHDRYDQNNIIRVNDFLVFRKHLLIAFECLSINLYEFIKNNNFQGVSQSLIRRFAIQILQALKFQKDHKIVHCDLKPENILLKQENKSGIKVIDYGSSCFLGQRIYTYIQSRFYRAPEIILGIPYTMAIDMWSFGCIIAELYTGYPIFPGENEVDQLAYIMEICGVPPSSVLKIASRRHLFFDEKNQPILNPNSRGKIRQPSSKTLTQVLRCVKNVKDNDDDSEKDSSKFLDFLSKCFHWHPAERMTPLEALHHDWILEGLPEKVLHHHLKMFAFDSVIEQDNLKTERQKMGVSAREKKQKTNQKKEDPKMILKATNTEIQGFPNNAQQRTIYELIDEITVEENQREQRRLQREKIRQEERRRQTELQEKKLKLSARLNSQNLIHIQDNEDGNVTPGVGKRQDKQSTFQVSRNSTVHSKKQSLMEPILKRSEISANETPITPQTNRKREKSEKDDGKELTKKKIKNEINQKLDSESKNSNLVQRLSTSKKSQRKRKSQRSFRNKTDTSQIEKQDLCKNLIRQFEPAQKSKDDDDDTVEDAFVELNRGGDNDSSSCSDMLDMSEDPQKIDIAQKKQLFKAAKVPYGHQVLGQGGTKLMPQNDFKNDKSQRQSFLKPLKPLRESGVLASAYASTSSLPYAKASELTPRTLNKNFQSQFNRKTVAKNNK